MTWRLYRWIWRLDGPLFVGTSPAGELNRCRLYVPARAIWGAVTAELARIEADDDQQYLQVGDDLRKHARFSYLYPAELVGKDWLAWLPEYREGNGLVWVREAPNAALSDRRLRRQLLWTRPATAIDPDSDSALDGSLRETECVQTRWRGDDGSPGGPVAMVGYVSCKQSAGLLDRVSALSTVFIGGDTRYGLGRLERVAMEPASALFDATVDLGHEEPHVVTDRLLAHSFPDDGAAMCGDQEAIGGWDMTGQQQDRRLSGPVWTPGSRCQDQKSRSWRLLDSGMLRLAEASR